MAHTNVGDSISDTRQLVGCCEAGLKYRDSAELSWWTFPAHREFGHSLLSPSQTASLLCASCGKAGLTVAAEDEANNRHMVRLELRASGHADARIQCVEFELQVALSAGAAHHLRTRRGVIGVGGTAPSERLIDGFDHAALVIGDGQELRDTRDRHVVDGDHERDLLAALRLDVAGETVA